MKNVPTTFQQLIDKVIAGLDDCECYNDDVIIYSGFWEHHMRQLRAFLKDCATNFTESCEK